MPQAKKELDIVNIAIQNAQLNHIHDDHPILFIVVASSEAPTGVLFQEQPTLASQNGCWHILRRAKLR